MTSVNIIHLDHIKNDARMCQEKTVHLCGHASYRKNGSCAKKQSQRSSCFVFFKAAPQCPNTTIMKRSTEPCPPCLVNDRAQWAAQIEKQRKGDASRRHAAAAAAVRMAEFAPQRPQAARLPARYVERGVEMETMPQYTYDLPPLRPTQLEPQVMSSSSRNGSSRRQRPSQGRPSTSRYVDTTRYHKGDTRVSGVFSGYADPTLVSPHSSVEDLRY